MDPNENHGFVTQYSAIALDLSSSKDYVPVSFIASLNEFANHPDKYVFQSNNESSFNFWDDDGRENLFDNVIQSNNEVRPERNPKCTSSIIFWDYYDKDRETFENYLFEIYEKKYLKLNSVIKIANYLKVCYTMCRCTDVKEAIRIFDLIEVLIKERNTDSDLVVSLLKTVGRNNEAVNTIFLEKGQHLEYILSNLGKAKQDLFGLWLGSCTLVGEYLALGHYTSVLLSVKYGLQWTFSESVLSDYCKQLNPLWTDDILLQFDEPDLVNFDRLFLTLQTFFIMRDWKVNGKEESLEAILMVWRSVPYPFITPHEMTFYLQNFHSPTSEISPQEMLDICDEYNGVFCIDRDEPATPRSLQDLSRCAIRNRLSENFQLPCGVSELNLPSSVLSYLKLER